MLALLACGAWSDAGAQASTPTTTTLGITSGGTAATTVAAYTMVTLTATVTTGGSPVSPGLVRFCDASAAYCTGVQMLGSAQLRSDGTAAWRFRPAVGTHAYKAVFAGTGTYAASGSATVPLTVTSSGGQVPSAALLSKTGIWGSYSLTATVEAFGATAPLTGNISFQDTSNGSAVLATAPLGSSVPSIYWATQVPCMDRLSPTATATADLNGDGYLDIAAVEVYSNLVAIYIYQPTQGCYQQIATYTTGASPSGIIVADLNSDGNADLVIPNYGDNTLSILLGHGDGTFTVSTVSLGSLAPYSLVAEDFNEDGIPDLAVGNLSQGVTILHGNGDGTFTIGATVAFANGPQNGTAPTSVISGDFNGDGKIDLVAFSNSGVDVYLGNGDGTFSSSPITSTVAIPTDTTIINLAPADFNQDGKLDLAVSSGVNMTTKAGQVQVLLGNGDGTFTASTPSTTPNGPAQLRVADFNLDGIPDIAESDIAGTITVLIGQGDGKLASPYSVTTAAYFNSHSFAVGDMDGDGRPDILYYGSYPPNSIAMYFGLTKPMQTATTGPVSIAPSGTGQHLVVASYAGDANATSATSDPASLWGVPPTTATALAATANGAVVSTVPAGTVVTLTASVTGGGIALTVGQVNFCDSIAPLCTDIHLLGSAQLTSNGTAVLKLIPAPGSHSYKAVLVQSGYGAQSQSAALALTVTPGAPSPIQTATTIAQSGSMGNYTLTATVSETGSGTAPTGAVSFLDTSYANQPLATAQLGSAVAGLALPISYSFPQSSVGYMLQALGDFNGDGRQDIAAINTNAQSIDILLNTGGGSFTSAPGIATSIYPYAIATGDFNHDGKIDIAVATPQTSISSPGLLFIYLGNGDGTFTAAPGPTTFPTASWALFVADVNGDGNLDLIVAGDYNTPILLGHGDGTFTSGTAVGSSGAIAVGDFNGDGIPDLILGYNSVPSVYLGNGDGTFTANGFAFSGLSGAGPAMVGDFNGDGIPDLAMASLYYSPVEIFLGKGDGTFTAISSSANPSIDEPRSIAIADLNGDGKSDLIATNVNSYSGNAMNPDLTLMLGNGDGTFTAITGDTQLNGTWSVFASDFNGDGTPDLSVGSSNGISVLLSAPTQTLTASATGVSPTGPAPHLVAASYLGDSNFTSSISGTTSLNVQVAAPVISATTGTYTSISTITITDATPGAAIYYQGTGTLHTNGYLPYAGPIPVLGSGSASLSVYATETGYQQSSTVTATYIFNFTQITAAPVFSLPSGVYSGSQQLTITSATAGVQIFYTTDGSTPSTFSTMYTGPIPLSTPQIVNAVAVAPGYSLSPITSAQYLFSSVATSLIYNMAGNGMAGYLGDGGPAVQARINTSYGAVFDSNGNLYFSDTYSHVIRKIDATTGIVSTVAGTGVSGFSGDGGAAAQAQLYYPEGLVFDAAGNLYIADYGNNRIRKIDGKTGAISTVLGNGTFAIGGIGSNQLTSPHSVAVDGSGNLYIGELYGLLKISATDGTISQIVNSTPVSGISIDNVGNLYLIGGSSSIYKLPAGVSTSYYLLSPYCIVRCNNFAGGTGSIDSIGDGGPATNALLSQASSIALDGAGNLYIPDTGFNVVRKVDAKTGVITAVTSVFAIRESGDGGLPAAAGVVQPMSLAFDASGNLAIMDASPRIREIVHYNTPPAAATPEPVFSVAAGNYDSPQVLTISDTAPGTSIYYTLDGSTPTPASGGYFGPIKIDGSVTVQAIALAPGYLPSTIVSNTYTIASTPAAIISTVAGSATGPYLSCSSITGGSAVAARQAGLGQPQNVALDSSGNLFISDSYCNSIWKVAAQTGTISLFAGNGIPSNPIYTPLGDGGPASSAVLFQPSGIALDSVGNVYIADYGDNLVRKVDAVTGIITSVAGNGLTNVTSTTGNGDGGQATSATVARPKAVAVDSSGNLYVSDAYYRVRKVTASTGIISTFAGNGTFGFSGDGGAATSAEVQYISAMAFDYAGNLYIVDGPSLVRKIAADTGNITTVAGIGTTGFLGDGGPATKAQIQVTGIAADPLGDLYLTNGNVVRYVSAADGTISTIAGSGIAGYWGDGGAATVAGMRSVTGLGFDISGDLYMGDTGNYVVRKLTFADNPAQTALPLFTPPAGTYTGTQSVTISDVTPGAVIYYTTDGSAPTTGSAVYSGAISVSSNQTLRALAIANGHFNSFAAAASYTILASQTVNFTALASPVTYGAGSMTLSASASSGLPIVFSIVSGPATVSGNTLTITGAGTVVIAASQAGNSIYGPAQATQTLIVNKATPIISWTAPATILTGAELSSVLTASASYKSAAVAGSFSYTATPAGGSASAVTASTLLPGGTFLLNAIFTPADTTDYNLANATATLVVTNPQPTIASLSPAIAQAGGASFPLTVTGTDFVSGSTVYWGGTALATTVISGTQLQATVPAASIATVGTALVTVQTPAPGGGASGNFQFEIDTANSSGSAPAFSAITATVTAGQTATYPVTLPSTASNVSITCLNLPAGASCTYSATANTVTIATSSATPKGTYQITAVFTETVPVTAAYLVPLLMLPIFLLRKKLRAHGSWTVFCLGMVFLAGTVFALGCGGGSSSAPSSPQTQQVRESGTVTLKVQ